MTGHEGGGSDDAVKGMAAAAIAQKRPDIPGIQILYNTLMGAKPDGAGAPFQIDFGASTNPVVRAMLGEYEVTRKGRNVTLAFDSDRTADVSLLRAVCAANGAISIDTNTRWMGITLISRDRGTIRIITANIKSSVPDTLSVSYADVDPSSAPKNTSESERERTKSCLRVFDRATQANSMTVPTRLLWCFVARIAGSFAAASRTGDAAVLGEAASAAVRKYMAANPDIEAAVHGLGAADMARDMK